MRLLRRHTAPAGRERTGGQSLVEFALVVPLILFLTVIALDFGRIYLGWVNLQSMTRIAANLAANNPDAWTGSGNAAVQARYQAQIRNDASATNCQLPLVGGARTAPAPTFTDAGANGSANDLGDTATVAMSCTFGVITPGISAILGSTVTVSSSASFPVKTGMSASGSGGGGGGSAPNAAFTGNGTVAPNVISGTAPFTVVFRDTSGGTPTSWSWNFADGTTSISQDPLAHTFLLPGTYVVSLTATNALGSSTQTMGVTVSLPSVIDFTINQPTPNAPSTITFTDASTPGGTAYAWQYGTGEGTGSGATSSHTYNTAGTYTVTLTVTYLTGPQSTTKSVTVGAGLCTVPSLNGVRRNSAPAAWTSAGFTGTVSNDTGAPNGNFTITAQSIVANSQVPCNSNVKVK